MAHPANKDALRTVAQNRAIFGLRGQLARAAGLPVEDIDPQVRDACRQISGHEHTSKLTQPQAQWVIAGLTRALAAYTPAQAKPAPAPHEPWAPRAPGGRDAPITAFQNVVIAGLFDICRLADGSFDTFAKRRAFVQRQCKVDWPATKADADRVITPLSHIALRHVDAEDMKRRALALQGQKLDAWKTGFVADLAAKFASQPAKAVLTPFVYFKIRECEDALEAAG